MFAQPNPDDPNDQNYSRFEPYDIYKLVGQALIAWAVVVGLSIPHYFS